ncbi:MAG TPA: MBL fold metallo-hydrolase, partial [Brevundimonas sp.]|nr:MBL fold metallo-hydrolase [Brevundimonas sp.]
DGDMTAYMDSLDRVIAQGFETVWPTHGGPIIEPGPFLAAYRDHRLAREAQIVAQVEAGVGRIADMVPTLYASVDPRLWPAASLSVWAHLIALERAGRVRARPAPLIDAVWEAS